VEEYESWAWSAPQKSFPFSGFSCPSMLAPSESWFMHDSSLIYGLRILSPEYCAKIFYLFLHSLRIILQFLGMQVVLCSSILFYSFVKCAKSWAVIQQYCSIANEVNYRWHPSSLNLNGLFMFLGRYISGNWKKYFYVKMRQASILYFCVGILAFLSDTWVQAEDPYRYYTWTVTYGTRTVLDIPQTVCC